MFRGTSNWGSLGTALLAPGPLSRFAQNSTYVHFSPPACRWRVEARPLPQLRPTLHRMRPERCPLIAATRPSLLAALKAQLRSLNIEARPRDVQWRREALHPNRARTSPRKWFFCGGSLLVDSVTVEQIAGWRGFPEGTAPRALADVAIERRIAGCRVATTASRAGSGATLAALS